MSEVSYTYYRQALAEKRTLQAENERLQAQNARQIALVEQARAERDDLQAECDQWQKKLTEDAWPEIERLRALLAERHLFPDYPGPADGEVSTVETWAEQEAWTVKWNDLDDRIRAALANKRA